MQIEKDKIAQQASLIRHQKDLFVKSAKEEGPKIATHFNLKDVAASKAELPCEQICLLKRAFSHTFGFGIFGSEKTLHKYVESLEMPLEGGTVPVTDQYGEQINVSFVQVTNVKSLVSQMINELIESGTLKDIENLGQDTLGLLLAGDNGSDTTNFWLKCLTKFESQSVRNAKLVGI